MIGHILWMMDPNDRKQKRHELQALFVSYRTLIYGIACDTARNKQGQ